MSEAVNEGGCQCGAVRYAFRGEPMGIEYCHCGMCRKHTGAPTAAWVDVSTDNFQWTRGLPTEYASSPEALRGFCAACGSPLSFRWVQPSGKITLTLGSLDRPRDFVPSRHIYDADRLPWLHLKDGLPRYPQAAKDTGPNRGD